MVGILWHSYYFQSRGLQQCKVRIIHSFSFTKLFQQLLQHNLLNQSQKVLHHFKLYVFSLYLCNYLECFYWIRLGRVFFQSCSQYMVNTMSHEIDHQKRGSTDLTSLTFLIHTCTYFSNFIKSDWCVFSLKVVPFMLWTLPKELDQPKIKIWQILPNISF